MLPLIETRSGIGFWPLEPRAVDINIDDIAHALSQQCRFSGHTREHYSVAEHCVRVADVLEDWGCSTEVQLWGLLHDASEAYLVDIPSPLKCLPEFAPYREAEARLMAAVCERFGLPIVEPVEVRAADGVLLATEARDLMAFAPEHWTKLTHAPLDERIVPWGSQQARRAFRLRFDSLMCARGQTDPAPSPSRAPTLIPNGGV